MKRDERKEYKNIKETKMMNRKITHKSFYTKTNFFLTVTDGDGGSSDALAASLSLFPTSKTFKAILSLQFRLVGCFQQTKHSKQFQI